MCASSTTIRNKNPGSDFRRARVKYSNFDGRQSYEQNINFPVAAQV